MARDTDEHKPKTYYLRSYGPRREHFASTRLKKVRALQILFPGSAIEDRMEPIRH